MTNNTFERENKTSLHPLTESVSFIQAIVVDASQPAVHYIVPAAGDQYHTHDNCNSFLAL